LSDSEIREAAVLRPLAAVAGSLGIPETALIAYGRNKAKLELDYIQQLAARPHGKLILVTAITPTPAGEGKTTTSIGLGDGLQRLGRRVAVCLRQPSLGPCFGQKGGATGGGRAQVMPMQDINLHFTGDFHAVTAATNLLAAMAENHLYWGNDLALDPDRISWHRAIDMNDRGLRHCRITAGHPRNHIQRTEGFDITAASEVMAILCLAGSLADLERRLSQIVVGQRADGAPLTAGQLGASGAMAALLRDAIMPNLVQSLEGTPTFVHGGPFANIAHGCNSVIATRTALKLADYVVTEAGFGADLGAEKFINIKCRKSGLAPALAVLVCTARALKMHGGVERDALQREDLAALERGFANMARHIANLQRFGLPVLAAVNRFASDTAAELDLIERLCRQAGIDCAAADHWARGGSGAEELAQKALQQLDGPAPTLHPTYDDALPLAQKLKAVATGIYGAADIALEAPAATRLAELEAAGLGHFPICIAKTQYSFSADPKAKGAPVGHVLPIREIRLAAGAEFVVAICGDIMTMPGLPRHPAAEHIGLDSNGHIVGLA